MVGGKSFIYTLHCGIPAARPTRLQWGRNLICHYHNAMELSVFKPRHQVNYWLLVKFENKGVDRFDRKP